MDQSAGHHSRKNINKLNSFHHRCIRTILGIGNRKQWEERISMAEVRRWGERRDSGRDGDAAKAKVAGSCGMHA